MSAAPDLAVIRDDVRAMHAYAVPSADGLVKLDAMENPYGLPQALARALGERLAAVALNRYPPSDPTAFKRRLAAAAGLPAGMQLMLGNGSDELIHLTIMACARPGTTVLAPEPSFVMYGISARLNHCRYQGVPLDARFGLDVPSLLAALAEHRPAIVFLADPNNPTGNLLDAAAVEAVLDAAPGLIVIDEAYLPFARRTWIGHLGRRPNLLVMRTLSKLGLAGVRLGYLCGDPAWIGELEKVRPPYNVGGLPLAAADFMLDHLDVLEAQAAALRAERDRLLQALRGLPGVQVYPSDANFVLLRVPDAARAHAGLVEGGVLVKNVSGAHPSLARCLRLTVGTPAENDLCLAALGRSL